MSARLTIHPTFNVITDDGVLHRRVPFTQAWATAIALYWMAVDKALRGDTGPLEAMRGRTVKDRDGNRYRLSTDIDAIDPVLQDMHWADMAAAGTDEWGYPRGLIDPYEGMNTHGLRDPDDWGAW